MKSGHVWFVPLLEVITAPTAAELRRSTWMKRVSSIVPAKVLSMPTVPIDARVADEEDVVFSSVVRLGA
jgi:hypothetical protein